MVYNYNNQIHGGIKMEKKEFEENLKVYGVYVVEYDGTENKLKGRRVSRVENGKVSELYEKMERVATEGYNEPYVVINSKGEQIFPEKGQGVLEAEKAKDENGKDTDVTFIFAQDGKNNGFQFML